MDRFSKSVAHLLTKSFGLSKTKQADRCVNLTVPSLTAMLDFSALRTYGRESGSDHPSTHRKSELANPHNGTHTKISPSIPVYLLLLHLGSLPHSLLNHRLKVSPPRRVETVPYNTGNIPFTDQSLFKTDLSLRKRPTYNARPISLRCQVKNKGPLGERGSFIGNYLVTHFQDEDPVARRWLQELRPERPTFAFQRNGIEMEY
ncbi:hypothetical protein JTE90_024865 [Oedothorax gibbosus]|uniref:Uncharacterized protein n=1 Tax=Oedothorax gibbosus TaxID=931172 RepID=A0AAV6V2W6_9ARAC|nr:hypothetical protein JTE90_024865 [Oedothorax gibbosus]